MFSDFHDFNDLLEKDSDKALMLLAIKRMNKMSKLVFDNKVEASDVCVIVEKWTDAILWDFGLDLVVVDDDKEFEEAQKEDAKENKEDSLPKTFESLD